MMSVSLFVCELDCVVCCALRSVQLVCSCPGRYLVISVRSE